MKSKKYKHGAALGRYCPMHSGHGQVISTMQNMCEDSLVIVGSANAPWSLPVFFNYAERATFIQMVFPGCKIAPLPDFPGDNDTWLRAIKDILNTAGFPLHDTVFFGGADEDVIELTDGGTKIHFVNRFDGTTPIISATQVRDALIHNRPLDGLIDPIIQALLLQIWSVKWPLFQRKR